MQERLSTTTQQPAVIRRAIGRLPKNKKLYIIEAVDNDCGCPIIDGTEISTDDILTLQEQCDWYKSALQKIAIRNAHGVMVTIARDALKDAPGGQEWL